MRDDNLGRISVFKETKCDPHWNTFQRVWRFPHPGHRNFFRLLNYFEDSAYYWAAPVRQPPAKPKLTSNREIENKDFDRDLSTWGEPSRK